MMALTNNNERFIKKQDIIHVAILMAIALVIGVYLIVTTVLISKDGVFYIEQAQKFSANPVAVIKAHPPGFPYLIFISHKFTSIFANSSSVHTWIYSAQSMALLCRLLALIPLYLIGKLLVGGRIGGGGFLIELVLACC